MYKTTLLVVNVIFEGYARIIIKKSCKSFDLQDFAEREGFEPPVPLSTAVFKTAVIDHSTISPCANGKICLCLICECKDKAFYWLYQIFFSHSVVFTRFLRFL